MSKWDQQYRVFDTPCFPAKWKVGRFEDDDNGTCNYFRERRDAENEANRRNIRPAVIQCECETCGIGYHLPSGKCDHCNSVEKSNARKVTA